MKNENLIFYIENILNAKYEYTKTEMKIWLRLLTKFNVLNLEDRFDLFITFIDSINSIDYIKGICSNDNVNTWNIKRFRKKLEKNNVVSNQETFNTDNFIYISFRK